MPKNEIWNSIIYSVINTITSLFMRSASSACECDVKDWDGNVKRCPGSCEIKSGDNFIILLHMKLKF